jgi:hypothetical protein
MYIADSMRITNCNVVMVDFTIDTCLKLPLTTNFPAFNIVTLISKPKAMTKFLPLMLMLVVGIALHSQAQNTKVEAFIVKTGEIIDEETLDTLDFSSDDAEQINEEIDGLEDDDLDFGWEGTEGDANVVMTGLRFQDLAIPVGATIDSAWLVLYAHEGKSTADVANITILGEDADSAATFTEDSLITARPATDASVSWIVEDNWIIYFPYRTPDVKAIIQEIVDRDGWKSGNALSLVLKGEDQGASDVENSREIESFENIEDPEDLDNEGIPGDGLNHPERVPTLVVYYSETGATAIKDNRAVKAVKAFPNPVNSDRLSISFPSATGGEISLYDITGKIVKSQTIDASTVHINVTGFAKGVYILKTLQGNKTETQKIVIE